MKTIKARLNHGRWIADCPDCASAEIVIPGREFMCMGEALDKARSEFKQRERDLFVIPSHEVIARARQIATLDLPHYAVEFPSYKDEIDALMAERQIENKNWELWETLTDLRRENKAHGIKA